MLKTREYQGLPEAGNKVQAEFLKAAETTRRIEEFSRHVGSEEIIKRVHDKHGRFIFLDKETVSKLQLRAKMSCKWEEAGDSIMMTPLEKAAIQAKIIFNPSSNSFMAVLPKGMQPAQQFKAGDDVEWSYEGRSRLSLEKVLYPGIIPIVTLSSGGKHGTVSLPKNMALALGLGGKKQCEWNEEGNCLIITPLEFKKKDRLVSKITENHKRVSIYIPGAVQGAVREGDEVIIKGMGDGKLYMWRMEDFPGETGDKLRNITKIRGYGSDGLQATITNSMAKALKLGNGMHGVWTLHKGELWLELTHENPHITAVIEERTPKHIFSIYLPDDIGKSLKEGDRITLEVWYGKLYIQKK